MVEKKESVNDKLEYQRLGRWNNISATVFFNDDGDRVVLQHSHFVNEKWYNTNLNEGDVRSALKKIDEFRSG